MDDLNLKIVNYQSVVEATVMAQAAIDVREYTERRVRAEIVAYCQRQGVTPVGPILLDWTCRGSVRVSPQDPS